MAEKLTEYFEIPKTVRTDDVLKKKLRVVSALRNRRLQDQVRHSLMLGVDQEIAELGQKAFDLLCGEKLVTPQQLEIPQMKPGPTKLENVGNRRRKLA